MKEIKTTKTIEEVTGYEAVDGTRFCRREDCLEYESSYKGIVSARVRQHIIGEEYECNFYDNANDGDVWIVDVKDKEVAQAMEQLFDIKFYDGFESSYYWGYMDKYIGKQVLVIWNYDHDWATIKTLDEIIEGFKDTYNKAIEKKNSEESE